MKLKIKTTACSFLAIGLLAGCSSEKNLETQARVSRGDAERTALTKAPGGTVKEGELEKEHGKLIWSFDIAKPGERDITEVHVDAISGEIVSVENESAEKEAKEKEKDNK